MQDHIAFCLRVTLLYIDNGLDKLGFGIPGEQYPGILADFGNEGVHQRPALRFGVDGCKVGLGQHFPDDTGGLTGIHQIVDEQPVIVVYICRFQYRSFALIPFIITGNTDSIYYVDLV